MVDTIIAFNSPHNHPQANMYHKQMYHTLQFQHYRHHSANQSTSHTINTPNSLKTAHVTSTHTHLHDGGIWIGSIGQGTECEQFPVFILAFQSLYLQNL